MSSPNQESQSPSNQIHDEQVIPVNPNQPRATYGETEALMNQGQTNQDLNVNDTKTKNNPTRDERIRDSDGFYNHSMAG